MNQANDMTPSESGTKNPLPCPRCKFNCRDEPVIDKKIICPKCGATVIMYGPSSEKKEKRPFEFNFRSANQIIFWFGGAALLQFFIGNFQGMIPFLVGMPFVYVMRGMWVGWRRTRE